MSEAASLELQVRSDGVVKAGAALDKLTESAKNAEKATESLSRSFSIAKSSDAGWSKKAADSLSRVGTVAEESARAMQGFGESMRTVSAQASPMFSLLTSHVTAFAGAFVGIEGIRRIVGSVIEITSEFERLQARLVGVTGGTKQAAETFEILEEIADATIYTEEQLTDAFLKLANMGLTPSERALKAYADIASATGVEIQTLVDATVSASMGMTRGLKNFGVHATVEGENLKVTFRGITEVIKNDAESIQNYLIKIGETSYAGAAGRQLRTMGGAVKELRDEWEKLIRSVGQGVIGETIELGLVGATKAIVLIRNAVRDLGNELASIPARGLPFFGQIAGFVSLVTGMRHASKKGSGGDNEGAGATGGEPGTQDRLAQFNKNVIDAQEERDKQALKTLQDGLKTREQKVLESYWREHAEIGRLAKGNSELAAQMYAQLSDRFAEEMGKRRSGGGYTPKVSRQADTDFAKDRKNEEEAQKKLDQELADLMNRDETIRDLEAKRLQEAKDAAEAKQRERGDLLGAYNTEYQNLVAMHEQRLAAIQDAAAREVLTEKEKNALLLEEEERFNAERREYYAAQSTLALNAAEGIFGNLAAVAKKYGSEQSDTYRTLFAIQKAFAMAQSAVAIASGTAKALELGWPHGIVAGLQVAAQGAALIAQISGATYSGSYDQGGRIPAGGIGIVGEFGPEIVAGPAQVTSRKDTARMLERASSQSAAGPTNLRIVNTFDPASVRGFMGSTAGEAVIMNTIRRNQDTIRTMVRQ
jgi:hypothetical protein